MRYPPLLLLLVGCAFQPPDEQPLFNSNYRAWFASVEQCTQHAKSFDRIIWHVADLQAEGLRGKHQGNNIWIDRDFTDDEGVIKHESLHYLIGDPQHTRPEWKKNCL